MITPRPYPERFRFARLFGDAAQVFAVAGFAIAIGIAGLGVLPIALSDHFIYRLAFDLVPIPYRASIAFHPSLHAWIAWVSSATALVAYSMTTVFTSAISIGVLGGASWQTLLRPSPLTTGILTSLSISFVLNWWSFGEPVTDPDGRYWMLGPVAATSWIVLPPFVGVAVQAAIIEGCTVGRALARSYALLGGLRWRMLALSIGYVVLSYAVTVPLVLGGVVLPPTGVAATLRLPSLIIAALGAPLLASFYLQARRNYDGPTSAELGDVFA